MRFAHDVGADALYIYVTDGSVDHTEELTDGTVVDVGSSGELVGVEILAVSSGWNDEELARRFELSTYDRQVLTALTHPPLGYTSGVRDLGDLEVEATRHVGSTGVNLVGSSA